MEQDTLSGSKHAGDQEKNPTQPVEPDVETNSGAPEKAASGQEQSALAELNQQREAIRKKLEAVFQAMAESVSHIFVGLQTDLRERIQTDSQYLEGESLRQLQQVKRMLYGFESRLSRKQQQIWSEVGEGRVLMQTLISPCESATQLVASAQSAEKINMLATSIVESTRELGEELDLITESLNRVGYINDIAVEGALTSLRRARLTETDSAAILKGSELEPEYKQQQAARQIADASYDQTTQAESEVIANNSELDQALNRIAEVITTYQDQLQNTIRRAYQALPNMTADIDTLLEMAQTEFQLHLEKKYLQ